MDHVLVQASNGELGGENGHVGTDGSKFNDRMNRYADWISGVGGENISYGNSKGIDIIMALFID